MLCLRDPADATNDLGRKGTCIKHVQATLKVACHGLRRSLYLDQKANTVLTPLLGPIVEMAGPVRKRLQNQGYLILAETVAETSRIIREQEQGKNEEKD